MLSSSEHPAPPGTPSAVALAQGTSASSSPTSLTPAVSGIRRGKSQLLPFEPRPRARNQHEGGQMGREPAADSRVVANRRTAGRWHGS